MIQYLQQVNEDLINGERNALETYVELKRIEKLLKDVMDGAKDSAIDEAMKYGKGEHEEYGVKFQVKEGGGRWSYAENEKWSELNDERKSLEKKMQMATKAGGSILDEDTGEVIQGAEFKGSSTTIAIRL